MISLTRLLEEISSRPKAIIFAGSPGAGKSSLIQDYIQDFDLKVLNIDNFYKNNLQQAGVSLDLKNANADQRSKSSTAMQKAIKEYQAELERNVDAKNNIVLDATSGSFKKTAELKNYLVQKGYDVMMVYVFASLKKALKRNDTRFKRSKGQDRSLPPAIVLQTWVNVTKNFDNYRNFFGDNFISVVNDKKPYTLSSAQDIISLYIEPYTPRDTKPKSPTQVASSEKQDQENIAFIEDFLNKNKVKDIKYNSKSKDEVKSKVKNFLKS
jgi:predicted kinase